VHKFLLSHDCLMCICLVGVKCHGCCLVLAAVDGTCLNVSVLPIDEKVDWNNLHASSVLYT